jgi:hypothetical protein
MNWLLSDVRFVHAERRRRKKRSSAQLGEKKKEQFYTSTI